MTANDFALPTWETLPLEFGRSAIETGLRGLSYGG